jgi:hypothetical protein
MHAQLDGLGAADAAGVQARQIAHLLLRPHFDHLARVALVVAAEPRVPRNVPATFMVFDSYSKGRVRGRGVKAVVEGKGRKRWGRVGLGFRLQSLSWKMYQN